MKIFKYDLRVPEDGDFKTHIEMPYGSEVLSVQVQFRTPRLWALVTNSAPEMRSFMVVPTGVEVEKVGEYIGTFQLAEGAMVFHVFEAP